MGLQDKFLQNGSTYGAGQGGNSADLQSERDAIIGDLKQSKLHFDYSINGNPPQNGNLPSPSGLDLNGINPLAPNSDPQTPSINNSFKNGTYKNSAPAEGVGRI